MEWKLLWILLVASPVIIIMFIKPRLCFYAFLIARPIIDNFDILRTKQILGSINTLQAIGIIWPFLLIAVCVFYRANFWKYKIGNLYLCFTFLCLPCIFISNSWTDAVADWLRLFTFWAVLIFVLHFVEKENDIKEIFLVILCASFYPMLRFIISFAIGETFEVGGIERIVGGYFHMGPISSMLFLFVPAYLFFLTYSTSSLKKFLLLGGILFLSICIYTTYYRSALVAVFVLICSYLFLKKKYYLLFGLIMSACVAFIFSTFLQDRFVHVLEVLEHLPVLLDPSNGTYDKLLSGRFGIWRRMLTTCLYHCGIHNLFFGFGYRVVVDNFLICPHDDYLSIFFQNGFIALVAFLSFLGSAILTGIRSITENTSKIVLSLLIGSVVIALTENFFVSVRNLLYLGTYIGLLIKSVELKQSKPIHGDVNTSADGHYSQLSLT